MKDYTETDFQKSMFITRYIINMDTNSIEVIYADGEVQIIPYNVHNEIMILERMKNQVTNYKEFKDNAKVDRTVFRIKKYLSLGGACLGTVVLAHLGMAAVSVGLVGVAMVPTMVINVLMILILKKHFDLADDEIIRINDAIKDYDKSLFYIKNEKAFDNERIKRKDVISHSPDKTKAIVRERELYHLSAEVPSININSLDSLSMRELQRTYEASLQSSGREKACGAKHK